LITDWFSDVLLQLVAQVFEMKSEGAGESSMAVSGCLYPTAQYGHCSGWVGGWKSFTSELTCFVSSAIF